MHLDIKFFFHFRYDSECTERYGWMYMYYRRVDDPYRIPQWGFVAAPHHCACKITPKYIPDSWFFISAILHELKSAENYRDSPPKNCSRMISYGDMPIQMFTEDDGGPNRSGIFKCLIYWSCFMLSSRSRIKMLKSSVPNNIINWSRVNASYPGFKYKRTCIHLFLCSTYCRPSSGYEFHFVCKSKFFINFWTSSNNYLLSWWLATN